MLKRKITMHDLFTNGYAIPRFSPDTLVTVPAKIANNHNSSNPSPADSQECIIEFLKAYRSFPCLWKYNDKHYRNKDIKDRAYAVLTEKMREFDPSADRGLVLRKINSLRTAFRREYKKINRPLLPGENAYRTNLWYYNLLKFVVDEQDPDTFINTGPKKSEMQNGDAGSYGSGYDSNNDETMDYNDDDEEEESVQQPLVKVEMNSPTSSRSASPEEPEHSDAISIPNGNGLSSLTNGDHRQEPITAENLMPRLRIAKKISVIRNDGYQSAYGFLTPDFDLFGTYVAAKLKRVSKRQSVIAEKIIAEVLMRASLGTLEEKSCFNDVIRKQ